MLRNLSTQGKDALARLPQLANQQAGQLALGADQQNPGAGHSNDRQQLMNMANSMVKEDPKRVAQVLNGWVGNDE
jgi:flagellar biosynthesis/type III secretory pathway M-ring protein FliF/YscJ